jgi:hypothetical protein
MMLVDTAAYLASNKAQLQALSSLAKQLHKTGICPTGAAWNPATSKPTISSELKMMSRR